MIPTAVQPSAALSPSSPRAVAGELRRHLERGVPLRADGLAAKRPNRLFSLGYQPKFKVELFSTVFYLSGLRQNEDLRFFVGYVLQGGVAYARLFYKDVSLQWRCASHRTDDWIGKGDVQSVWEGNEYGIYSAEATTDLPLEVQGAFESASRSAKRIPYDVNGPVLVLRRGPANRVAAYRDFTEPRRRAQANPRNLIHGNKRVAYFSKRSDPKSLRFAAGFEPDFRRGILDRGRSRSKLYGGVVRRYRILSRNRLIQYQFMASPRHVWIIPPQALTTELSTYGVRTIDVHADEDLFVPGFEYHFFDDSEDPPELVSQIPKGFAGAPSKIDPSRCDASRWLDPIPVIRDFRGKVLRR